MSNSEKKSVSVYWMRRDLRLEDNAALHHALKGDHPVVSLFIFDWNILHKLEDRRDARVQFLHRELLDIKKELQKHGSDIEIRYGKPENVLDEVTQDYNVSAVYTNNDYEPYARERDSKIGKLLKGKDIAFNTFKDHVIFEKDEVLKDDGDPYVVYTPYSRKWLAKFSESDVEPYPCEPHFDHLHSFAAAEPPSLEEMGFSSFDFEYPSREIDTSVIKNYGDMRDIPGKKGTSRISMHLRFGTLSIRAVTKIARKHSDSWLNELIWRNFYQVIIWHFPESAERAFRQKYEAIPWRNDKDEFDAWCEGRTGYPIVDPGMRELNTTGFMHNRVRMVVASFLTKHLLIDWRWGEAYFAAKLLDFELASNNGGWQWASGSGCDAAPYFRVFNPESQMKKFDPEFTYIKKWVPEFRDSKYPDPIVPHKESRKRAIDTYKSALS
ncbi:MAG: DNA photolyase family protein [Flavobacteriales bacterium]|nr:DNA photolyase family protein [Flavobacteriales bacterium]